MKIRELTIRSARVWPAALLIVLFTVALSGLVACSDDDVVDNDANGGEITDTGADAADTGDTESEGDTGPGEDADTGPDEPEDRCEVADCDDDQMCYHGSCFETCESFLDCESGQNCRFGRCFDEVCDDLECDEGFSCFRGSCYEACNHTQDCGIGGGITCEDGGCVPLTDQCDGIECSQYFCPEGQTTTVKGTVNIPSGDYPLPNVTVYVPSRDLAPLPEGATCATCEQLLSGDPILQNITDVEGRFELPNFPIADEVPLVIQTGKWRREVTVTGIEPCVENELDENLTRLPRNQAEGNIPKIAVAAGGCDSMECLVRDIGLDDSEFTTNDGDGSVHLFSGQGGVDSFDSGELFADAAGWWEDADNMLNYDIFLNSCECSDQRGNKSILAYMAFEHFLNSGGRAFLSHFQRVWLMDAVGPIKDVAIWREPSVIGGPSYALPQTGHSDGQEMRDWLGTDTVDALDEAERLDIDGARISVESIDESVTTEWLYWEAGSHSSVAEDTPAYFSFNLPLGTEGDDACGRAIFADLHVSGSSSSFQGFPTSCGTSGTMSEQERALVYMLFDLSACIAPECEPRECEQVKGQCGVHPDQCGGIVECGPCCSNADELCTDDSHCCEGLSCNQDTGFCTD